MDSNLKFDQKYPKRLIVRLKYKFMIKLVNNKNSNVAIQIILFII